MEITITAVGIALCQALNLGICTNSHETEIRLFSAWMDSPGDETIYYCHPGCKHIKQSVFGSGIVDLSTGVHCHVVMDYIDSMGRRGNYVFCEKPTTS